MRWRDKSHTIDALIEDGGDLCDNIRKFDAIRMKCWSVMEPGGNRMMNRAAYLVILTIDALQVATGKENIANASGTADCRFLSPMDAN